MGEIDPDGELETDVCIVGAGAAGITLARELIGAPFRVCLLESGGYEPDPATQALYRGEVEGPPHWTLDTARLRYFGGTTNHWTGWCRALAPICFEERAWVPDSGWPIPRSELEPYWARAASLVEIDESEAGPPHPLPFAPDAFETGIVRFSAPTRFGQRYRAELERARNVSLVLDANVTGLRRDRRSPKLRHVDVACLDGRRFRVRARLFVLATGGIENPRLLLASNDVEAKGLGNAFDAVGRYFTDHIGLVGSAHWLYRGAVGPLGPYAGNATRRALLDLSAASQRRERLLMLSLRLVDPGWKRGHRPTAEQGAERTWRAPLDESVEAWLGGAQGLAAGDLATFTAVSASPPRRISLNSITELPPLRENRVTLDEERDALGLPRVKLRWQVPTTVFETTLKGLGLLAREVGRLGLGRVRLPRPGEITRWPDDVHTGTHPSGTTRMSGDPARGVVDGDCLVHGLENLYVAGSSTFPGIGTANPTLTIVALALRLARRIGTHLAAGGEA